MAAIECLWERALPAIRPAQEGLGTCFQDIRAVGNSRIVHRDVLNVS